MRPFQAKFSAKAELRQKLKRCSRNLSFKSKILGVRNKVPCFLIIAIQAVKSKDHCPEDDSQKIKRGVSVLRPITV